MSTTPSAHQPVDDHHTPKGPTMTATIPTLDPTTSTAEVLHLHLDNSDDPVETAFEQAALFAGDRVVLVIHSAYSASIRQFAADLLTRALTTEIAVVDIVIVSGSYWHGLLSDTGGPIMANAELRAG